MPRYDQHFLRSESIAGAIAVAAEPLPQETILEIGPGRGILSAHLLAKHKLYLGVEIDPVCFSYLKARFPEASWIQGDVLGWDWPEVPLYVVSNLPYSITGPVLFRILAHRVWVRGGVLMLQAEVARRLYAKPGSAEYGRLSVVFQGVYAVERVLRVGPGAFSPPPKVYSEVIRWVRQPLLRLEAWPSWAAFVKVAFRQPRKTLENNLRAAGLPCPPAYKQVRPHQLSPQEFIALWQWSLDLSKS